ncbi:MAG TPA: ABC transporter permease [Blastocatellia bacterium]|nr:ABC transporter permease [Blastocatellia bacterium]HMX29076.1 ABC transporter permease [Blastocatellia bacterium]HMZ19132.1 ABC transporter permease [Blastocatellia bacterium]HNG28441.1 ABC transporter permease [Blastocatellia bacterium]
MKELLSQTWTNLMAHKLRSFLTMFGIIWGVISIVLLSAVSEGFQQGNLYVLKELGKNIIIIRNGRTSTQAGGERAGRLVRLDIGDVHALKEKARLLEHVTPELMRGGVSAKSAFNAGSTQMSGVWPVYQFIRTIEVDRGRLLSEQDNLESRRVVVIGTDMSKQLFADRDPIGQQLSLNGLPYTVIGRVRKKEQDSNYTGPDNNRLFLPYETMRKDFPMPGENNTSDSVSAIIAAPYEHVANELNRIIEREGKINFEKIGPVEQEVLSIIAPRHNFDPSDREALSMWNTALETVFFNKMISSMREFFIAVSIITLALGGIGVMNIMLISVKERTKEIGIRKALGATSGNVLRQFFSEGLLLTLLSGTIGLGIGIGLCKLINLLPLPARFSGMILTWQAAAFSVGVLALIGIVAATYPARRASSLPPIEALRYEM